MKKLFIWDNPICHGFAFVAWAFVTTGGKMGLPQTNGWLIFLHMIRSKDITHLLCKGMDDLSSQSCLLKILYSLQSVFLVLPSKISWLHTCGLFLGSSLWIWTHFYNFPFSRSVPTPPASIFMPVSVYTYGIQMSSYIHYISIYSFGIFLDYVRKQFTFAPECFTVYLLSPRNSLT